MGDVVIIYVEEEEEKEVDLKSCSSPISLCRICHEEEFGSSKKLESPCACSGTVKVTQFSVAFAFVFWVRVY